MKPEVSLVLPCYNESKHIAETAKKTDQLLAEICDEYEIIIAEDGSTDGTDQIAKKIDKENPRIRHIHRDRRLGKGRALRNAFKETRGKILVFMDADASTDPAHISEFIEAIRDGYDICIGVREQRQRETHRRLASAIYNWLTRTLLGSSISDHQCGLKAFKAETMHSVIEETRETGWLWDTELLVKAQRSRLKVKQVPVNWRTRKGTSMNLLLDPPRMLTGLLRIRRNQITIITENT